MTYEESIKSLAQLIENSKSILISTHRNPDGDAMGSSLAWYLVLKKLGKKVQVILPDNYPKFYGWMSNADDCLVYENEAKRVQGEIAESDLIFSLDYNAFHRTTEGLSQALKNSKATKVLVDHHREPDKFDLMFSDITASSTSEMVYKLCEKLGFEDLIDKSIAECIYTGIVTDTGSFRFSSTSSYTLEIASKLMKHGMNAAKVQSLIYDNNSEQRLRLMGFALSEKMTVNEEKHYAYMFLTADELKRFHYEKGDTEGLVNYPLSIASVSISVLITERNDEFRMSFRSKGEVNVNDLARKYFEGGGHQNAAGGISRVSYEATLAKLEEVLPEFSTKLN